MCFRRDAGGTAINSLQIIVNLHFKSAGSFPQSRTCLDVRVNSGRPPRMQEKECMRNIQGNLPALLLPAEVPLKMVALHTPMQCGVQVSPFHVLTYKHGPFLQVSTQCPRRPHQPCMTCTQSREKRPARYLGLTRPAKAIACHHQQATANLHEVMSALVNAIGLAVTKVTMIRQNKARKADNKRILYLFKIQHQVLCYSRRLQLVAIF